MSSPKGNRQVNLKHLYGALSGPVRASDVNCNGKSLNYKKLKNNNPIGKSKVMHRLLSMGYKRIAWGGAWPGIAYGLGIAPTSSTRLYTRADSIIGPMLDRLKLLYAPILDL